MTTVETLPGKEPCPGHFTWSAFGAGYPDTVCASALTWPDGYQGHGLCDADDDFRERDVPCPFCEPVAFIAYQWGEPGDYMLLWKSDETSATGAEVHFHDDIALWWTATHPERGEERLLFRKLGPGGGE